ncbi:unnamed protein product, partial [Musa banksii]
IAATRSPPAPIGCVEELVAASACLPHVAALPEEARAPPAPSAACCKAVLAAVLGADGGPACLCHLIRRPGLFGFPVNASRIAALFSSCSAFGPPRRRRFLYGILPRSVFSCFMFLSFAFRVSLSSDVFCFLVLGNVAEARALPPLRSNTSTTLTEPVAARLNSTPRRTGPGFRPRCRGVSPDFCIRPSAGLQPRRPASSGDRLFPPHRLYLLLLIGTQHRTAMLLCL